MGFFKRKSDTNRHKITITSRILICFLASTLIPTVLIISLLCIQFSRDFKKTAAEQMEVSQSLITENLSAYFKGIESVSTAPFYHSYFLSATAAIDPDSATYMTDLYRFQNEMRGLLNLTTYSRKDISDLLILSDGQYLFYDTLFNQNYFLFSIGNLDKQPWYIHATEAQGKLVFSPMSYSEDDGPYSTSFIIASRQIRRLGQSEQSSYIIIGLDTRAFDDLFSDLGLLYDSFIVMVNEEEELLYSSRDLTSEDFSTILRKNTFSLDGSHWISSAKDVDDFGAKIYLIYSTDDISRHTGSFIFSAVLIYLAGLLIAFALYRAFNKWLFHSTEMLQSTFSEIERGNLTVRCPEVDVAEFNNIGVSINGMITVLDEKIKNEYLLTIKQKNVQLYALQAQIQPHFLINTLYSFIALNQMGERKRLSDGFYSLAHLLRYVLSREPLTTVSEELALIDDYTKLQKLRFGDRLHVKIECDERFGSVQIPRLMLQPLVENAIVHGIEPCEHPCFCTIRVYERDGRLHLSVEDDGVGFDVPKVLVSLRDLDDIPVEALSTEKHESLGLNYVMERLHLWAPTAELRLSSDNTTVADISFELGVEK